MELCGAVKTLSSFALCTRWDFSFETNRNFSQLWDGRKEEERQEKGGKKKKARILDHLTKLLKSHSLLITSQRCPWVVSLPRTQRDLCLMYFTTLSLGKWNVSGGEKLLRLQPYPLGFRSAWDQQLGVFSLKLWRQRPTTNARGLTSWFHTLGQSP